MKSSKSKRILLILPEALLEVTDDAARGLHMSRLAFIRNTIVRHVGHFHLEDKPLLDDLFHNPDVMPNDREVIAGDCWFDD